MGAEEPAGELGEILSLAETFEQARVEGEPVEDLSQRTESTSVFANPDGTVTHRDFGGPVRIEVDGEWVDVDYTLVERPDGSYAPKAAPVEVSVNAGPADEAARVTFDDGESMAVTWSTDLPDPVVDGGVATYKLSAVTDLIIAVTSEGLNAHIRLNEAPAADDPVFTFGLRTKDVNLVQSDDGGLEVLDDSGDVLGETRTLVAWDAETDAAGEPVNVVPLEADLSEDSSVGATTDNSLDLTTPEGFLADPDTQYPVTIDPDIKVTSSPRDIWVRDGVTEGQGSDSTLRVGKIYNHSNTKPARSYVSFSTPSDIGTRTDVQVISAELNLWQYYGFTCSSKRMNVYPTKDAWSGNITWPDRPTSHLQDNYYSWISTNRGTSGCAQDWSKVDVTKIAKAWWQTREIDNNGFTLLAYNEDNHDHERRFCSKENDSSHGYCNTAARRPFLDVTYASQTAQTGYPQVSVGENPASVVSEVEGKPGDQIFTKYTVKSDQGAVVTASSAAQSIPDSRKVSTQAVLPALPAGSYVLEAQAMRGAVAQGKMKSTTFYLDGPSGGVRVTTPAAEAISQLTLNPGEERVVTLIGSGSIPNDSSVDKVDGSLRLTNWTANGQLSISGPVDSTPLLAQFGGPGTAPSTGTTSQQSFDLDVAGDVTLKNESTGPVTVSFSSSAYWTIRDSLSDDDDGIESDEVVIASEEDSGSDFVPVLGGEDEASADPPMQSFGRALHPFLQKIDNVHWSHTNPGSIHVHGGWTSNDSYLLGFKARVKVEIQVYQHPKWKTVEVKTGVVSPGFKPGRRVTAAESCSGHSTRWFRGRVDVDILNVVDSAAWTYSNSQTSLNCVP